MILPQKGVYLLQLNQGQLIPFTGASRNTHRIKFSGYGTCTAGMR